MSIIRTGNSLDQQNGSKEIVQSFRRVTWRFRVTSLLIFVTGLSKPGLRLDPRDSNGLCTVPNHASRVMDTCEERWDLRLFSQGESSNQI